MRLLASLAAWPSSLSSLRCKAAQLFENPTCRSCQVQQSRDFDFSRESVRISLACTRGMDSHKRMYERTNVWRSEIESAGLFSTPRQEKLLGSEGLVALAERLLAMNTSFQRRQASDLERGPQFLRPPTGPQKPTIMHGRNNSTPRKRNSSAAKR